MPRKIKQLIKELENAGSENRGSKGSYRNFVHPKLSTPVTISRKLNDDAKQYQEKATKLAIEKVNK